MKQDRQRFDIFKFPVCRIIFNKTMAKNAKTREASQTVQYLRPIFSNIPVLAPNLKCKSADVLKWSGGLQNMELQRCYCNSFKIALGVEYIVWTCFNLKFKNGLNIPCILMNNGFLSVCANFIIHLVDELKFYHFIAV